MSINRLSDLKQETPSDTDAPTLLETGQSPRASMLASMHAFLKEIDHAQAEIDQLKTMIDAIVALHAQQLLPGTEVNLDEVNDAVEAQVSDISRQLMVIKKCLKRIDMSNDGIDHETQDYSIRTSQTATCRKRFMDMAKRYQDVQHKHRQTFHDRLKKEYKIAHPDASDEQVEEAISAEKTNVFADQVLHSTRYGEAKAVLKAVQERHEDVKRIEKTILELNSLFQEMATMVEQQGDLINSIEHSVTNAALYTEDATVQLDKAIDYRKSSRRKLYILMACCCVLFFFVGSMVYSFAIKPLLPSRATAAVPPEAEEAAPGASAESDGTQQLW